MDEYFIKSSEVYTAETQNIQQIKLEFRGEMTDRQKRLKGILPPLNILNSNKININGMPQYMINWGRQRWGQKIQETEEQKEVRRLREKLIEIQGNQEDFIDFKFEPEDEEYLDFINSKKVGLG